ncbi:restriction endonuclease subunit S [Cytobacillus firmus]|uniref:restriction endonuclease subunit S n=1 Tax=Cytobacillus firmus TaxID=1399 RepID=UPI0021C5AD16|nr:restriction endonuclease subunit S [Cytobacillus firmus]MCU1807609.1 restriction endonuclease subunit S [Cytobacillus firmus]
MTRILIDSGIEWIGQMPSNWRIERIGSLFKQRNEKVSDDEYQPLSVTKNGIVKQLENAAKSNDHSNRKKVCINDFVINSRSDRKMSSGVSKLEGSVSLINIVLHSNVMDSSYVHYLLKNYGFAEEFYRWGTGIVADLWSTNYERMKRILIPYPSLEEQQKIAKFLDENVALIDSIIENTKLSIEELKRFKQSVITEAVTKGLNPSLEMKDSQIEWIGEIPKHWELISIGNAFFFLGGYAYKSDRFVNESDNQVIRIGNVKNDNLLLDNKQVFIDDEYAQETKNFLIKKDDILFTMTGTKGKKDYFYTLLVKDKDLTNKKLFINQRVGCFRKKATIYMNYFNYLLKNQAILDSIFIYETGTANQANLGIETIKRTKLIYPPIEEQVQIAEYLDEQCFYFDGLLKDKEQLISNFEDYKKSLIYEYVTGKKEVL